MGITINSMSREMDEIEQYLMTISPAIVSMKDVADGTSIAVDGTLLFTDEKVNKNGEVQTVEILSIITPDKQVYSCQSATFKRSLNDIQKIMNGKPFAVLKMSGTTNAGRPYIDCQLDIASISPKKSK